MKRLWITLILGVSVLTLAACGDEEPAEDTEDGSDDNGGEETPEDHSVEADTLETLSSIIGTVEDEYQDWDGKMLVNDVTVDDPANEGESRDIRTRIHTDSAEDRFYVETLDVSDEDTPETLNYLYVENGTAYSFESAEMQDGEDNEDRYEKMEEASIEDNLPDIDEMFNQTFQYFPSDKESAEMQGMTLLDASAELDEAETAYEADVNVLMQSGTGEQNEDVWSLSGDDSEVTVEMPVPTLGTVTFRETDFDDAVDSIDKDRHTWSEDDGSAEDSDDDGE